MKLEQLQLAAFEPLQPAVMRQVTGGTIRTGCGVYGGKKFASDCAEYGDCGQLHIEFYNSNGGFMGEYNGPDPCP